MLLYHGTSESVARTCLTRGLSPRTKSLQESNWLDAPSHPDMVYLTTAYAPYFAMQASHENERWAILEIDSSQLESHLLRPDEDFLEQASRGQDVGCNKKTLEGRTKWFRDNIDDFDYYWEQSLDHMGVVAYKGVIPPSAISSIVLYEPNTNLYISTLCADPSVSIMNYRFVGQKYIHLTNWFFNRQFDLSMIAFGASMAVQDEMFRDSIFHLSQHLENRKGIEIIQL